MCVKLLIFVFLKLKNNIIVEKKSKFKESSEWDKINLIRKKIGLEKITFLMKLYLLIPFSGMVPGLLKI